MPTISVLTVTWPVVQHLRGLSLPLVCLGLQLLWLMKVLLVVGLPNRSPTSYTTSRPRLARVAAMQATPRSSTTTTTTTAPTTFIIIIKTELRQWEECKDNTSRECKGKNRECKVGTRDIQQRLPMAPAVMGNAAGNVTLQTRLVWRMNSSCECLL